jgi:hypothetical protein
MSLIEPPPGARSLRKMQHAMAADMGLDVIHGCGGCG